MVPTSPTTLLAALRAWTLGAAARKALDLRANITMMMMCYPLVGPDSLKREEISFFGIVGIVKCEVFT